MTDLPTGTVTFVFTDIEGSTQLLRQLGDAYHRVQDDHAAIVRAAVSEADGVEVATEGDSFFLVFRSALNAVQAAVATQRRLGTHDWTHGEPLRVRMGMHTGEGIPGGDNYLGIDVNRAARIAASAHGGQVLLSDATRGLVEDALPSNVGLRDLGEHRLKDFDRPTRLFQLTATELQDDFPPPRTLEVATNLPAQRTTFIGRERELEALFDLVRKRRLVTLTGPGGTGKTRLAIAAATHVAEEFPSGVFFVELAPVSEPALVPSTIAGTLHIREEPQRPVVDTLKSYLSQREMLLVLDNFEQILDAASLVGEVLDVAPKVKSIVTSRAPLGILGEQEFSVPPLSVPHDGTTDPDHLSRYEAVALFVERARAVDSRFALTKENAAAVAEICARVDGLPLAIELAASRVRMLTPHSLLERLDRRLSVLSSSARDVPERQRTLTATIAWSHDLLAEPDRALFRRLAAFVGGWTLETAEKVANPNGEVGTETLEGLESLGEKSLVQRVDEEELRFGMLETIREYGLERLGESGELELIRSRHANEFLHLAEEAGPRVTGMESTKWLDRLTSEHDNLRAALRWSVETASAETGLRLGTALWRFWQIRGHLEEGRQWMNDLFDLPGAERRTPSRAKALVAMGSLAYWQNDLKTAERLYEEGLEVSRELEDPRGIADGLFNLAFPYAARGEVATAERFMLQARQLFEELGDERQAAFATSGLGMVALMGGDVEKALAFNKEARARFRSAGDLWGVGLTTGMIGVRSLQLGRLDEARPELADALDIQLRIGDLLHVAVILRGIALVAARRSRYDVALRLSGAADRLEEGRGSPPPLLLRLEDPKVLARGHLPPEQIESALYVGRQTTLEEATRLARKELALGDA